MTGKSSGQEMKGSGSPVEHQSSCLYCGRRLVAGLACCLECALRNVL